jgi:hypothetical protein
MKKIPASIGLPVSAALLVGAAVMGYGHFDSVRGARATVLPLAAQLVTLQHRSEVLQEQIDLAMEASKNRTDSATEKLHAYVLPDRDALPRLLSFFEEVEQQLRASKSLRSMSTVEVSALEDDLARDTLVSRVATVSFVVTQKGAQTIQSLLDLSGTLTVGDAFTPEELQELFNLTEVHNAAGVVAMESFLNADLLAYARAPRKTEQPVLQAFSSDAFLEQFHALLKRTRVDEARALLGSPLGDRLATNKLWPVQFMMIDDVRLTEEGGEWMRLDLVVRVFGRKS